MRRRLLLVLATGIALLAAFGIAVFVATEGGAGDAQIAPDGTTVRLLKVTSGTEHRYTEGNLLQRTAVRLLPDSLARKLKIASLAHHTTNFSHVFWFGNIGFSTNVPPAGRTFVYQVVVRDDGGGLRTGWTSSLRSGVGRSLVGLNTPALPCGSRTVRVELHRGIFPFWPLDGSNSPSFLAAFDLPNPEFLAAPRWQAQAFPIQVQEDGLNFNLHYLAHELVDPEEIRRGLLPPSAMPTTKIECEVSRLAGSVHHWSLREIRAFDERGHQVSTEVRSMGPFPGRGPYRLAGLSPTNQPVKLRFEFIDLAGLTNYQHTFTNVVLPAFGATNFVPLRAQAGAFTVALLELQRPGYFAATLDPPDPSRRFELIGSRDYRTLVHLVPEFDARDAGSCRGLAFVPGVTATNDYTFIWPRKKVIEVIVQPLAAPPLP